MAKSIIWYIAETIRLGHSYLLVKKEWVWTLENSQEVKILENMKLHKGWENLLSSRNLKAQFKFSEINFDRLYDWKCFRFHTAKLSPEFEVQSFTKGWHICVYLKLEKGVNLWQTNVSC